MEISSGGSGYQIIILSGFKLHTARSWTKISECDGEVLKSFGFVANGNNFWSLIVHSARIILFLRHTVDDVLLGAILWANEIQLVVFPRKIAFVNINNIVGVVQTKDGVGCIPEHKVGLNGIGTGEE